VLDVAGVRVQRHQHQHVHQVLLEQCRTASSRRSRSAANGPPGLKGPSARRVYGPPGTRGTRRKRERTRGTAQRSPRPAEGPAVARAPALAARQGWPNKQKKRRAAMPGAAGGAG
jgi:hypothetical protein